jgi:hypothetical protein
MRIRFWKINFLFIASMIITITCSGSTAGLSGTTVLVGSTPGDQIVKSMLSIGAEKPIDFIRWDLALEAKQKDAGTFALNLVFGEGQPNTSGFKGGGEKLSRTGTYTSRQHRNHTVYDLKGDKTAVRFSLGRLTDDLYHLLSPSHEMMVGNGGWSYTLVRRGTTGPSGDLPLWTTDTVNDAADEVVFDGRTPCQEFAAEYRMSAGPECHKLKWKLTLYRDSATKQPTAYKLQHTLIDHKTVEGKWVISKAAGAGPGAIIYRLDPDNPEGSMSFLVGDENVLFFLDRRSRLLAGNEHFGYTLNRRISR